MTPETAPAKHVQKLVFGARKLNARKWTSGLEPLMQVRAQQQVISAATGLHAGCCKVSASLFLLISPDADDFCCCALACNIPHARPDLRGK